MCNQEQKKKVQSEKGNIFTLKVPHNLDIKSKGNVLSLAVSEDQNIIMLPFNRGFVAFS